MTAIDRDEQQHALVFWFSMLQGLLSASNFDNVYRAYERLLVL